MCETVGAGITSVTFGPSTKKVRREKSANLGEQRPQQLANDIVINYLFVCDFERRLIASRPPGDGALPSAAIT